jgi:hypothetical protein
MEKIKLTLNEILLLNEELSGSPDTNKEKRYEGFLNLELPILKKYHLTKLNKELNTEKETVEKMKNELITKYGKKDQNDNYSIQYLTEDNKVSENYIKFVNEFNELLNEEKEINVPELSIQDIQNISTRDNYQILFKLIKD